MRSSDQRAERLPACIILAFSVLLQSGVLGYLTGTTAGAPARPRAMADGDQVSGNRTGRSLQGLLGFLTGFRLGQSLTSAIYGTGLNEVPNYSALYNSLPFVPVYSSQHILLPHLPLAHPVGTRPPTPRPHDREQEMSINETQVMNVGHQENTKESNRKSEEIIADKLLRLDNDKNGSVINVSLSNKKYSMTDRSDDIYNDDLAADVESVTSVTDENVTAVSLETNGSKLSELRANDDKKEETRPITTMSPVISANVNSSNETISTIDMTPTRAPPFSNSNLTWSYYPYYGKPTGNENISITTDSTNTITDRDFGTFTKYFSSLSPPLTNSIDDNTFSLPVKRHDGFTPVLSDFLDERNYVRGSYDYQRNQAHDKSHVYWGRR